MCERRLRTGLEYLMAVRRSLSLSWKENFERFGRSSSWIERLASAHPAHYEQSLSVTATACPVRGKRTMHLDAGAQGISCQSHLLWGYRCPYADEPLEADHLFPYSWGGPSLGTNKIFLCKMHNRCKASDIHLYPWELGEPPWLKGVLQRLDDRMRQVA